MISKIKRKFKEYLERNRSAHDRIRLGISELAYENGFSIPELPEDVKIKLKSNCVEDLHVLEILNDDLTPISFVVELVQKFCLQPPERAYEIAVNTHKKGQSQALTGPKEALAISANLIESTARKLKYPLKCRISKV